MKWFSTLFPRNNKVHAKHEQKKHAVACAGKHHFIRSHHGENHLIVGIHQVLFTIAALYGIDTIN